nr:uncharacterized protein LOC113708266 [Coffea arabica]
MNVKAKLKHFIWKCLQQCLPVNEILSKRLRKGEGRCGYCGEAEEMMEHLFFECENATQVWKMAPVRWEGLQDKEHNLWLWWEQVTQALKMEQGQNRVNLTINILWQIWKSRNKKVFEGANQNPLKTIRKAQAEWLEFEQERETQRKWNVRRTSCEPKQRREKPREGVIRMYTDAAISAKGIRTGQGIIARNWKGILLKAKGVVTQGRGIASKEEALAIRNALLMAKQQGWTQIIVPLDCKSVVEQINRSREYDFTIATILEDVQDLSTGFERCSFVFIPRTENVISHVLARFAVKLVHDIEWENDFPIWLVYLVKKDCRVVPPFL